MKVKKWTLNNLGLAKVWKGAYMDKRKAFFKQLRPEQFSDSVIVSQGQLNKDFFGYYLDTLTSQGLEKNSRIFAET